MSVQYYFYDWFELWWFSITWKGCVCASNVFAMIASDINGTLMAFNWQTIGYWLVRNLTLLLYGYLYIQNDWLFHLLIFHIWPLHFVDKINSCVEGWKKMSDLWPDFNIETHWSSKMSYSLLTMNKGFLWLNLNKSRYTSLSG